jgi:dTDP-glucose pyrophosphorylase
MKTIHDFEAYRCGPQTTIREVLARIDASPHLFQIVVDEAGRLLGTVTDGDIRRAMLQGAGLDEPASRCMQREPTVGRVGETVENQARLANLGSSRPFLPVVDENRIVRHIVVGGDGTGILTAVVMAGGPGTRLGERTRNTPKPLLPVGGRPILDHILGALESNGVRRVMISVHYLASQIESFVAERSSTAEIEIIHEPNRLGTAGILGMLGDRTPREPFLVMNGDVLTKADLTALHEFHNRHRLDGTVVVARYEVDVPFGVVRYGADGLFAGIEEKPRISNYVAAGVYLLSPEFVGLVSRGRPLDMPELLNLGRDIGLRIGLFPIHEYWTDIGRPDDLEAADMVHRAPGTAGRGKGA